MGVLMGSVLFVLLVVYLPVTSSREGTISNGEAASDQLLRYDEATRKVVLQQSTLDKLSTLRGPLHIITAIGDARIGKSTAFNVMAAMLTTKDKKGKINSVPSLFSVCQSLETCTKGVWLHTLPLQDGGYLVMLDVEGTDLGSDMITTQFSLLTSLLSSHVLVFLKESFPKRTGIFLHELARLKENLRAHTNQVSTPQALYVIIRDPLKPPQDVSLKTYVTQVLTDPSFCIDHALEECKLLEKHFPLNQVNVYSMPYVSRRHQKTFEWALKDKTYLKTISSLAFELKSNIDLSLGSETTGAVFSGVVRTFIQTLVHSGPVHKPVGDTCEKGATECRTSTDTPPPVDAHNMASETPEIESLPATTNEEIEVTDGTEGADQVGSIDVEKIIKSPFETMGPGVYSFVMHNVLRMKPSPVVPAPERSQSDDDDDDDDDDNHCQDKGCLEKSRPPQDTLSKWSRAFREFIDDISDALDDFFSSVLAE